MSEPPERLHGHALKINGKSHKVDADPDIASLWVLRDLLGMNGTKVRLGVALWAACTVT